METHNNGTIITIKCDVMSRRQWERLSSTVIEKTQQLQQNLLQRDGSIGWQAMNAVAKIAISQKIGL